MKQLLNMGNLQNLPVVARGNNKFRIFRYSEIQRRELVEFVALLVWRGSLLDHEVTRDLFQLRDGLKSKLNDVFINGNKGSLRGIEVRIGSIEGFENRAISQPMIGKREYWTRWGKWEREVIVWTINGIILHILLEGGYPPGLGARLINTSLESLVEMIPIEETDTWDFFRRRYEKGGHPFRKLN